MECKKGWANGKWSYVYTQINTDKVIPSVIHRKISKMTIFLSSWPCVQTFFEVVSSHFCPLAR